jgi:hypothetical protein
MALLQVALDNWVDVIRLLQPLLLAFTRGAVHPLQESKTRMPVIPLESLSEPEPHAAPG